MQYRPRTSFRAAPEYDTGERWTIRWETRRPEGGRWNDAVTNSREAAVERAKHLLKLGFIVHDISGPGGVYLNEKEALQQLGPAPAPVKTRAPATSEAS
ncbi:MAG: hypothetical protein ACREEL_09415 [Stellaceae bacterium]